MTAPAPSPESKPRSKRLYLLWATALTLLLALGLFCGLVVVPVLQTRAATARYREIAEKRLIDKAHDAAMEREIVRLGGKNRAARKLRLYMSVPGRFAADKTDAIALLGYCGKAAVPTLVEQLEHPDYQMRGGAACSLAKIGPDAQAAIPALARMLRDSYPDLPNIAGTALANIGEPAVPVLRQVLRDSKAGARTAAAYGLYHVSEKKALDQQTMSALVDILGDGVAMSSNWASSALAIQGSRAFPLLSKLLNAEDRDRRFWAVVTIANMKPGTKNRAPSLSRMLKDKDPDIRGMAEDALFRTSGR